MNRRALFQLVGGTAFAALSGRRQLPAAGRDTLARVLGLALGEEAWLNDLTRSEQRELYLYLSGEGGGPPSRRARHSRRPGSHDRADRQGWRAFAR